MSDMSDMSESPSPVGAQAHGGVKKESPSFVGSGFVTKITILSLRRGCVLRHAKRHQRVVLFAPSRVCDPDTPLPLYNYLILYMYI